MNDEIVESAKAVQEIAKTTGQAISTVEKIGRFFSRIMNESIDTTCGMMADTLKFKRWERQLLLIEKAERIINDKNIYDRMRPVPPKLALPIFEYASLEEDETLHDIWANLLTTSIDSSCEKPRYAYIDIIRQLEPIDVAILNKVYELYYSQLLKVMKTKEEEVKQLRIYMKETNQVLERILERFIDQESINFPCQQDHILNDLNIDISIYRNSIDNLIRQRLIASYISQDLVPVENNYCSSSLKTSFNFGYEKVVITSLGVSFVHACM